MSEKYEVHCLDKDGNRTIVEQESMGAQFVFRPTIGLDSNWDINCLKKDNQVVTVHLYEEACEGRCPICFEDEGRD